MFKRFPNTVIALILVLLGTQLGIFLLSADGGESAKFSVYCTGPATSSLGKAFGLLHLLFALLVPLGLASLRFLRLRLLYVVLLVAALGLLPVQAHLVSEGTLTCDGT